MKYSIYYLFHPIDVYLGYVGHSKDPLRRACQHFYETTNKLRTEWVNAINLEEVLVATVEEGTAQSTTGILKREQYWMNIFRRDGFVLLNMRDAYPDWGNTNLDPEYYTKQEIQYYKVFDEMATGDFFKELSLKRMGIPNV